MSSTGHIRPADKLPLSDRPGFVSAEQTYSELKCHELEVETPPFKCPTNVGGNVHQRTQARWEHNGIISHGGGLQSLICH